MNALNHSQSLPTRNNNKKSGDLNLKERTSIMSSQFNRTTGFALSLIVVCLALTA
jgi:hypothetical protein